MDSETPSQDGSPTTSRPRLSPTAYFSMSVPAVSSQTESQGTNTETTPTTPSSPIARSNPPSPPSSRQPRTRPRPPPPRHSSSVSSRRGRQRPPRGYYYSKTTTSSQDEVAALGRPSVIDENTPLVPNPNRPNEERSDAPERIVRGPIQEHPPAQSRPLPEPIVTRPRGDPHDRNEPDFDDRIDQILVPYDPYPNHEVVRYPRTPYPNGQGYGNGQLARHPRTVLPLCYLCHQPSSPAYPLLRPCPCPLGGVHLSCLKSHFCYSFSDNYGAIENDQNASLTSILTCPYCGHAYRLSSIAQSKTATVLAHPVTLHVASLLSLLFCIFIAGHLSISLDYFLFNGQVLGGNNDSQKHRHPKNPEDWPWKDPMTEPTSTVWAWFIPGMVVIALLGDVYCIILASRGGYDELIRTFFVRLGIASGNTSDGQRHSGGFVGFVEKLRGWWTSATGVFGNAGGIGGGIGGTVVSLVAGALLLLLGITGLVITGIIGAVLGVYVALEGAIASMIGKAQVRILEVHYDEDDDYGDYSEYESEPRLVDYRP